MNRKKVLPWLYSAPFLIIVVLISLIPLIYTAYISFTNMGIYKWFEFDLIGFQNYKKVLFTLDSGFLAAIATTLLWTFLNMAFMLFFGFLIALGLNTQGLRLKRVYKTLLIFPWAMPAYVSILLWRMGMFNTEFGFLNQILKSLGFDPINFLSSDLMAFLSCLVVNLWLGLPYMITMFDGAIQSVDKGIYESAKLEGANFWQTHFKITAPIIKPILAPAFIMTAFTTFKQFDIIFLMTMQTGSRTGAEINTVITYVYEKAFVTSNYGFSSASSVVVFFIIVLLYTLVLKFTRQDLLN